MGIVHIGIVVGVILITGTIHTGVLVMVGDILTTVDITVHLTIMEGIIIRVMDTDMVTVMPTIEDEEIQGMQ